MIDLVQTNTLKMLEIKRSILVISNNYFTSYDQLCKKK